MIVQLAVENDDEAPEGTPETVKLTVWLLPLTRLALTMLETEEPPTTETLPPLLRAKSNPTSLVNQALASELGFAVFLKALALTRVLVVTVNGPEYFFDDVVGESPSVV